MLKTKRIKGISLFSSAGIDETYLEDIDIVVSNELLDKSKHLYSKSHMIIGDIKSSFIKEKIDTFLHKKEDIKFLLATPPCQGLSTLGKNKVQNHYIADSRNFLVFEIFYFIDKYKFDYILIENVSKFVSMFFPYEGKYKTLVDILVDKYSSEYNLDWNILNAKDYGVPQSRPRAIIKIYKKRINLTLTWKTRRNYS